MKGRLKSEEDEYLGAQKSLESEKHFGWLKLLGSLSFSHDTSVKQSEYSQRCGKNGKEDWQDPVQQQGTAELDEDEAKSRLRSSYS